MPSGFIQQQIVALLKQAAAALGERDWRAIQELSAAILAFERENEDAIGIATELGMKPLLERVLAQREILKA